MGERDGIRCVPVGADRPGRDRDHRPVDCQHGAVRREPDDPLGDGSGVGEERLGVGPGDEVAGGGVPAVGEPLGDGAEPLTLGNAEEHRAREAEEGQVRS